MFESRSRIAALAAPAAAVLAFTAVITTAGSAAAQEDPEGSNDGGEMNYQRPPATRRGGFTAGVIPTFALAHFSGTLNEVDAINDPAAHQSATTLGFGVTTWFGGTLRDWFGFGLGYSFNNTNGDGAHGTSQAYLLHLEGFPLFGLGGPYRDLGLSGDFGIGTGVLSRDNTEVANGGDMAHVALTAFYEPLEVWKLSMGPAVSYSLDFSQALEVSTYSLGFRVALYTGQPRH